VKQALQAKESDRPTTIEPEDTSQATAGPSTSNETPHPRDARFPYIRVHSSQLAVDSETERKFNERDAQAARRRREDREAAESGSFHQANGVERDPLSSRHVRRRWASSLLQSKDAKEDDEDDEDEETESEDEGSSRTPPFLSDKGKTPRSSQPGSPVIQRANISRSSSFIARLRTRSFPIPGFGSFRSQTGSIGSSASRNRASVNLEAERWSSDSTDADEDVPWSGAMSSPKSLIGSRFYEPPSHRMSREEHDEGVAVGGVDDTMQANTSVDSDTRQEDLSQIDDV